MVGDTRRDAAVLAEMALLFVALPASAAKARQTG